MAGTVDLTQGPIHRQLIALTAPLLMGNLVQQLYNTVDTVIVGRVVGDNAFAAVGVAGSVMNLFLFLISGSCVGVSVLLSQRFGQKDHAAFRQHFFLAALFGSLFAVVLTLAGLVAVTPLLHVLNTPEEIIGYAIDYLHIIFLGFLACFAFNLCSSTLRSAGNTGAALLFLVISMATNLILDLWFIAGLRWGVAGAAWATVISQSLAAGLCLVYLLRRFPQLMFRRADMRYSGAVLRRIAHFSSVSALHMANLYIGKLLVQGTVNSLDTAAISAYTAATRIEGFANSFGDSGAACVSIFVGQNTGAGNYKRVKAGFFTAQKLLTAFGIVICILLWVGAAPLLTLVLPENSTASLDAAVRYLRIVDCFYLLNFLASGLVGYFEGRGQMNIPVIGATGQITCRAILAYLLAPTMGLSAVALATGLGWIGMVIFWSVFLIRDLRRLPAVGVFSGKQGK